jgi:hypothetical protein
MMKNKTTGILTAKKTGHKSRTLDAAIKEVKKMEQVMISANIPKELHIKLKIEAAKRGVDMRDIIINGIKLYLINNKNE